MLLCVMVARSLSCGVGRDGRAVRRSRIGDGENEVQRAFQVQRTQAPYNVKSYPSITTVIKRSSATGREGQQVR